MDSNHRPRPYQGRALTKTELHAHARFFSRAALRRLTELRIQQPRWPFVNRKMRPAAVPAAPSCALFLAFVLERAEPSGSEILPSTPGIENMIVANYLVESLGFAVSEIDLPVAQCAAPG